MITGCCAVVLLCLWGRTSYHILLWVYKITWIVEWILFMHRMRGHHALSFPCWGLLLLCWHFFDQGFSLPWHKMSRSLQATCRYIVNYSHLLWLTKCAPIIIFSRSKSKSIDDFLACVFPCLILVACFCIKFNSDRFPMLFAPILVGQSY